MRLHLEAELRLHLKAEWIEFRGRFGVEIARIGFVDLSLEAELH